MSLSDPSGRFDAPPSRPTVVRCSRRSFVAPEESFEELLDRLDAALQKRWDDEIYIDEING